MNWESDDINRDSQGYSPSGWRRLQPTVPEDAALIPTVNGVGQLLVLWSHVKQMRAFYHPQTLKRCEEDGSELKGW
jgi:hypothetical protein